MNSSSLKIYFMRSLWTLVIPIVMALNACSADESLPFIEEETCFDGIRNQGEIDIDCGGPCPQCEGKMSATIDNQSWKTTGNINSITNPANQQLLIAGSSGTSDVSLIHSGTFSEGTYNLSSAIYTIPFSQNTYLSSEGTITFTRWDPLNKIVAGTFNFKAFNSNGSGDSIVVTNGTFNRITYN